MKRTGTKRSTRERDSASCPENGHAPAKGNVGNTERGGNESQARAAHDENAGEGTMKRMEEVLRKENIWKAYKRVKGNKGAPGVDKMTVDELGPFCKAHWEETRNALLNESYRPKPIRKVEIPKPFGSGTRTLGIPTVLDRMIQQAILQVLTPIYDPTFSDSSFGFRPGRNALQAIKQAEAYVKDGYDWVVDMDLSKFFDRVNHDVLMSRIARRIKDKELLRLLRRYLQAGMMEGGLVSPRTEGTPQGSPLSPLLSNILLDELDKELEARGHKFCRYADDFTIYVKSEAAGQRVMESLTKFLGKRLRLKINEEKSAVARPWDRNFLGYSFIGKNDTRVCVSRESVKKLRKKLKPKWKEGRGRSIKSTIAKLNQTIVGWASYFRLDETGWAMGRLDSWIRRKIRCIIWRQWKRLRTRIKKLISFGVPRHIARSAACSNAGPWKVSRLPAMNMALSKKTLAQMGLKSLFNEYQRFNSST